MIWIYILLGLLALSLIIQAIFHKKYYINLFDENSMNKIMNCGYELLEIKRKRKIGMWAGGSYSEHPLEADIRSPVGLLQEDIIEVYGVKKNNRYSIFKINWNIENAQNMKLIVNKLNEKINI